MPHLTGVHEEVESIVGDSIGGDVVSQGIKCSVGIDTEAVESVPSYEKEFVGAVGLPASLFDATQTKPFFKREIASIGGVNHKVIGNAFDRERKDHKSTVFKPGPLEVFFTVRIKKTFRERKYLTVIACLVIVENETSFIILPFDEGETSGLGRVWENLLGEVGGGNSLVRIVGVGQDDIPEFP